MVYPTLCSTVNVDVCIMTRDGVYFYKDALHVSLMTAALLVPHAKMMTGTINGEKVGITRGSGGQSAWRLSMYVRILDAFDIASPHGLLHIVKELLPILPQLLCRVCGDA
jgi:hypothetical protein